jgi:hypothetical protein
MPPEAIKSQLARVIEELSDAVATLGVIGRHYQEARDWQRCGLYLQFQHKLGEVLIGLDRKRHDEPGNHAT